LKAPEAGNGVICTKEGLDNVCSKTLMRVVKDLDMLWYSHTKNILKTMHNGIVSLRPVPLLPVP